LKPRASSGRGGFIFYKMSSLLQPYYPCKDLKKIKIYQGLARKNKAVSLASPKELIHFKQENAKNQ